MTQDCCQAALHSSFEQWGTHFAMNRAAVHGYWVNADLYEVQILIGVIALTQACNQAALHSSNIHKCKCRDTRVLSCTQRRTKTGAAVYEAL